MTRSIWYAVTSTVAGVVIAPVLPVVFLVYCVVMWNALDESKIARPLV